MPSLTVTAIQSQLHWEDKEANLRMFTEKIRAIGERTEIVALPEMFSTGFTMNASAMAEKMDGPSVTWMKDEAAAKNIILTGSLIIEEEGYYYNRLIWMLPNGQYGYYDKRHLFGYAGEDEIYTPGNKRLIGSVKGWKVHLLVCYDLRFPVWSRQQSTVSRPDPEQEEFVFSPEYDLLIYVANWPERRSLAWKTLLPARAIENQCYVLGVNRVGNDGNGIYHSGDSMIIDPMGQALQTKAHDESALTCTLQRQTLDEVRTKLPFLKDADNFLIQP